jgi:hypothetical protein
MILYHFTRKQNVADIMRHGIKVGTVPMPNAQLMVSLSSVCSPKNHGLITGQVLQEGEDREFAALAAKWPQLLFGRPPNRTLNLFDQTEAVIVIDIEKNDSALMTFDQAVKMSIGRSGINKNIVKAAVIVSAKYPLGMQHINAAQVDKEVQFLIVNKRLDCSDWYFYNNTVHPDRIIQPLYRNDEGIYTDQQ